MWSEGQANRGGEPWNWGQVTGWCQAETRRVLGSGGVSEDAAQEAALRAWRRRGQCVDAHGRRAWVKAIARNEAFRIVGGRPEEYELAEDHARLQAPDPCGRSAAQLDVRNALGMLSDEERRLLGLRYWADLTQAETAVRLGLPEGTVKVQLHRLRATLRTQLA